MFGFVKKVFFTGSTVSATPLSCISMTNKEIINVNSVEPVFYPFSIKTSKYSGRCNNINNPYVKMCVPDVVKNLMLKCSI